MSLYLLWSVGWTRERGRVWGGCRGQSLCCARGNRLTRDLLSCTSFQSGDGLEQTRVDVGRGLVDERQVVWTKPQGLGMERQKENLQD